MNIQSTSLQQIDRTSPDRVGNTRLHGYWLVAARIIWGISALLALGISVAAVPTFFEHLNTACTTARCVDIQLRPHDIAGLHALGLSLSFYASYLLAVYIFFMLVWFAIGGMIFWRKSDDRVALFVSFFLIIFVLTFNSSMFDTLPSNWQWLVQWLSFIGLFCFGLFFNIFPDGRIVPRWVIWTVPPALVWEAGRTFFPNSPVNSDNWPSQLGIVSWLVFCGLLIFAQIYRYRYVSTPVQRRQTKWVVFGICAALLGFLVFISLGNLILALKSGQLANLVGITAIYFFMLLIPISIGIAILRSRLFDIDVIINRALVYSSLTGILALLYFGLVFGLQSLFNRFAGQPAQSPLIIVGSTLIIAALFQPLRHRIQNIIDRRFYRRKYDAKRTVANFSATLRSEVELTQLSEQLVEVVEETMQPEHVSLWLNRHEKYKEHQAHQG
jgi:hypothetical protein